MKIIRPASISTTGAFTRASSANYFDSAGVVQIATNDIPRFTFDPNDLTSGASLLLEAAATNLLLNSSSVVTQNITVTATPTVLSFYGTGSITLSGVSSGTLVGTGANKRVSLLFTPTAGTLIVTPTGSCTRGQVETGNITTSYIVTTGSTVTRAVEANTAMMLSNVPELETQWSSATTYAVGAMVMDLASHKMYSSVQNSNLNHSVIDTAWWTDAGYNNKWSMFDKSVTSQTTQVGGFIVSLSPGIRLDSIVGLNCNANSLSIKVVDPTDGLVYSKTLSLTSDSGITNWYSYFYEPIIAIIDFILADLSVAFSAATITLTFNVTTGSAAVGGLVVGQGKELGFTEWGVRAGIIDYSVKTKDAFGNYNIVPRSFSKRADYSIQIPTNTVDNVLTLLAGYRGIPVVYVGSNTGASQQFTSTIVYGYYKDLSIDIAYNAFSTMSLQIEGLT